MTYGVDGFTLVSVGNGFGRRVGVMADLAAVGAVRLSKAELLELVARGGHGAAVAQAEIARRAAKRAGKRTGSPRATVVESPRAIKPAPVVVGSTADADRLRDQVLKMAGAQLADALTVLEGFGLTCVQSAPDQRRRETGHGGVRRRVGSLAGTHDWWRALSSWEQARLRRNGWVAKDCKLTADEVPGILGVESLDEAMVEWVRLTRIVDGARSLVAKRAVPAWCHQYELCPGFDDYDVTLLLDPDRAIAAAHVAEVDAEMAERDAA